MAKTRVTHVVKRGMELEQLVFDVVVVGRKLLLLGMVVHLQNSSPITNQQPSAVPCTSVCMHTCMHAHLIEVFVSLVQRRNLQQQRRKSHTCSHIRYSPTTDTYTTDMYTTDIYNRHTWPTYMQLTYTTDTHDRHIQPTYTTDVYSRHKRST